MSDKPQPLKLVADVPVYAKEDGTIAVSAMPHSFNVTRQDAQNFLATIMTPVGAITLVWPNDFARHIARYIYKQVTTIDVP